MGGCASRPNDLKEDGDTPLPVEEPKKADHVEENEMVEKAADGSQSLGLLLKEEEDKEAEEPIKEEEVVETPAPNSLAAVMEEETPAAPKSKSQEIEPINTVKEAVVTEKADADVKPEQVAAIAVAA